jgi:hypothetical protein
VRPDRNAVPDSEVFLFVHIPKTGGQTLREFFRRNLVFHQEFIHLGPGGFELERQLGLPPFERRSAAERASARVILGHEVKQRTHMLVPGKTPRYVTFLRDPAETIVSRYNFAMAMNRRSGQPMVDFEQWYATFQPNYVTNWLYCRFMEKRRRGQNAGLLKKVMKALDRFWFVGCTEYLDRDAPVLLGRIGLHGTPERTNVSGVHFERVLSLDSGLRQTLYAKNPLDLDLYQLWKERLPQSLAHVHHGARATLSPARSLFGRLRWWSKT